MTDDPERLWVDSMPDAYDRLLGRAVFHPFAMDLVRRVCAFKPQKLLELAAGTGLVTRELTVALPEAEIIATDLNSSMVSYGARHVPGAQWEQADAQRLPYPNESFDLILCQFGVMFFPDKPAAFAEARRVLSPGGRLVFNTWDAVTTHDFGNALVASLERVIPSDPPRFISAIPHGYADRSRVEADLASGGLVCVSAETVTLEGTAGSAAELALGFCTGTPLRAQIEARADLATVTELVESEMTARLGIGPVTGRMTAHVFEARSPG